MMPIKLSSTVPSTIASSVSTQPNVIGQFREKQKTAELQQLYQKYGKESQEYIDALNAANKQFEYFSLYNVNPDEEEITKIQQKDYSQDEPFQLMNQNPDVLRQRYEQGYYKDYFKSNPYAKDLMDKWYNDVVINKEKKDVEATIYAIQQKAKGIGKKVDVTPLQTEYSSLSSQATEQEQYRASELARVRGEEATYYTAEQERLNKLWSDFDVALGSANLGGTDYAEKLSNVSAFVTANQPLIEGSLKNYRKYEALVEPVKSPEKYAEQYASNPAYDTIIEGNKTIIRQKPQQFVSSYDWSEGSKTKRQYSTYSPHELVLVDNKLQSEVFRDVTMERYWREPDYKHYDQYAYVTKKIDIKDQLPALKQSFGTFYDVEKQGKNEFRSYNVFQKENIDYASGQGWTMPTPRGERAIRSVDNVNQQVSQPTIYKNQVLTVTPSNLFGNVKNKLQYGESEIISSGVRVKRNIGYEYYNAPSIPKIKQPVFPIVPKQQSKMPESQTMMGNMQKYIYNQSKSISKGSVSKMPMWYKDPFRL